MLRIAIVTAVRLEARAVARILELQAVGKDQWAFGDVGLFVMGIGAGRLGDVPVPGEGVIAAGVAGGLLPALSIGDVVVDELSAPLPTVPSARVGKIHSARSIVTTPSEKAALFAQTGAAAVEMENAVVRAWATANQLAYCGVRGISDTASQTLDPAVFGLVDEVGGIRPGALAKLLLTRPAMINGLRELGANTKAAANAAAEVAKAIVASGWPQSAKGIETR
jgi:hypothetical protein